jgi:ABC-type multidrug transport system fused ATPase/permease subunit
MDKLNIIKYIYREFFLNYPKYTFLLFLSMLIETIIVTGSILAIIPFADFMIDNELLKASKITLWIKDIFLAFKINVSFWSFGLLFVFLNFLIGVSKTLTYYISLRFKYLIIRNINDETLGYFFNSKWSFFNNKSQGKLLNTISKELNFIGDAIGQILFQIALLLKIFVFITIPIMLNWEVTLISFMFISFLIIPFIFLSKKNYSLGKIAIHTANIAHGRMVEIIQSAKIIIGYGLQTKAIKSYLKTFDNHMIPTIKSQTITALPSSLFPPLGMLSIILAVGISIDENLLLAELAAILWSLLSAVPIVSSILQNNLSIIKLLPSFEQLKQLKTDAISNTVSDGKIPFIKLNQYIKFNDVNFSYAKRKKTISKFNAIFKRGTKTALIGASGSGKSTVIDLLVGLQTPSNGLITIDNIPISDYKINEFRKKIGLVSQDTILFSDSIRNNLLWASNKSNEKELWESLKMANADKFVRDFPEKLDTLVGEFGAKLSGGQKQRLAIARALLRKPELLILDEATSSLDYDSEKLIQDAIDNLPKSMTTIIIAHRLSTIKNSDLIYVIKNGKIVESGSFKDLNNKNKYFYNMLKIIN